MLEAWVKEIDAAARRELAPPVTERTPAGPTVRDAGVMAFCFELKVTQSAEER